MCFSNAEACSNELNDAIKDFSALLLIYRSSADSVWIYGVCAVCLEGHDCYNYSDDLLQQPTVRLD